MAELNLKQIVDCLNEEFIGIPENLCFGMRIRGKLQIHRIGRVYEMLYERP